uniref:Ig-like domain-containing protein n=1 Tax=Ciona intestinalis TaxID=7719 RepID=F6S1I4_CIOIN
MELYSLVRILAFVHVALNRGEARHHSAEIIQRPDDVIGADCGKEIRVTCMARSRDEPKITRPTPDIEWWFKEQQESMTSQSRKIHRLDREERVKILVEVFTVVKSTLIIKDAQPGDEGVYQCRASNSPNRYKEGVNLYQHWKIEEAPVTNMKCGEGDY